MWRFRAFAILGGIVAGVALAVAGRADISNMVWLGTLILGGVPILFDTARGILHGRFAADIVASLAIVGAGLTAEYLAGSVVVLMQTGGEGLESYAVRRASDSLRSLIARAPRIASRRDGEFILEIPVEDVAVNDHLLVRAGDIVPVDGIILAGTSSVDESALTGEPLPVARRPGDELMSGSVCLDGALEVRALRLSRESQYEQVVRLVEQAQRDKAPTARLADRYAVFFTPLTLAVCLFGYLLTREAQTVVAVLVVATPCPLILAPPVAIISGINRAARRGIIVKGGAAIEAIGRIRAAIFDKTGTLTKGKPAVERILTLNGLSSDDVLRTSASLEQFSNHPLARALVTVARQSDLPLSSPVDVVETGGRGLSGRVDGQRVDVGSVSYAVESRLGEQTTLLDTLHSNGVPADDSIALVGIDSRLAGVLCFADPIRPGVPVLMNRLKRHGVQQTTMLTGDDEATASAIAAEAGIDDVRANLLPGAKATAVQKLKERFVDVAMVGDGINDAPALATASVGIAMAAKGAAVSAEAADIVITTDNLDRVADAVEIGQRTLRVARQSISIGLGVSSVLMVIAAFGGIVPTVGAILQEGLDVAVILNALRAR
jgi:heavy metal translocating P-type ATPase